jgi:hemerythrin
MFFMGLITWTQENSVGVKELDLQHQKMFSIINNLYELMSQSKAQEKIDVVFKELVEYANYHFSTEEKYFDIYNYEGKIKHTESHNFYKAKINEFIEKSKVESGTVISYQVLDFLEDWWMKHINNEDKGYTQCYNSQGLY